MLGRDLPTTAVINGNEVTVTFFLTALRVNEVTVKKFLGLCNVNDLTVNI